MIKQYILAGLMLFLGIQPVFSQNSLQGKISDAKTGEPLAGVNVYVLELQKGEATGAEGTYYIANIPDGKFTVKFSYVGYENQVKEFRMNGETKQINLEMKPTIVYSQTVVISGGSYSAQHENAFKIDVIEPEKISRSGSLSFSESMTEIPGVDMISKGPGVTKPVIRGLSMTNILVLNNGVRLENFQFSENHPFLVDEFGVDRIEVIKGPASLLYGSDAIGGVINVIHEKPAPVGNIQGDVNLGFHANTNGLVSNIGLKGSGNAINWGFRAGLKTHEDFKQGGGTYVPNSRFNTHSLQANAGLRKDIGTFNMYYDYNAYQLGMTVPPAVSLIDKVGRENDIWYQDLANHLVSSKNKFFFGNYKLDLNASLQMNNRQLKGSAQTPAFTMVDMDLTTFTYDARLYLPSGEGSEYILGLQGMNKNNQNHEAPNRVIPDADVNDVSLLGLVKYTFFDKLRVQAGARYEWRSIDVPEQESAAHSHEEEEHEHEEETHLEAFGRSYDNLSASLGATYTITEQWLLRANLASAYRTPNLAELTQDGMHGVRYEQGNVDLQSQRSYEADFSLHFHSSMISLNLAGFYNKLEHYIYLAPTADTAENGADIFRYDQTDAALYGGEASVEVYPIKCISFKADYAQVYGERKDGTHLPFIPHNKLRMELRGGCENIGPIHDPFVVLGSKIAFEQDHPAMFETATDGYTLIHFGMGGKFKWDSQLLEWNLRVDNLLDEKYIDHLSTLKDVGFYNMGRNISLMVKVPFDVIGS